MKFWRSFFAKWNCRKSYLLLLFIFSCSSVSDVNDSFRKKYSRRVEEIKSTRIEPKREKNEVMYSPAPTEDDIRSNSDNYYSYVDISKLGEKAAQNNLPSGETYEQLKAGNPSNSLPPDIFEVTYNTALHPPFQRIGVEFDTIRVPESDVYGVTTKMSDKAYLLVGGDAMQNTVDLINSHKTADDIEISKILVTEKKQLERNKKMNKIFDDKDITTLASLDKKPDEQANKLPKRDKKKQETTASTIQNVKSDFIVRAIKN